MILCGNKIDLNEERYLYYYIVWQVSVKEALSYAEHENIFYFEISAKTGENITKLIYTSVAELPFFEQFKVSHEDVQIFNELENENSEKNTGSSGANNLSILDSSRGTIHINRSEIVEKKRDCKC